MSYIEIKVIKAVAAVHRGTVNLAHTCLIRRNKASLKRRARKLAYAADLERLAMVTAGKAEETRELAAYEFTKTQCEINAAVNTVLNLRDDLNKIS